jgi:predicted porin
METKPYLGPVVAAAFALAALGAHAQTNVQIYGRLNTGVDNYRASGATAGAAQDVAGTTRVFDSTSWLGFKGTEDLGGGWSARFLLEMGLNVDTGSDKNQAGVTNPNTGFLGSRESWVALNGPYGEVRFGRQNIFWTNGPIDLVAAVWLNSQPAIANGTQGGIVQAPAIRQNNTISYWTPVVGGLYGTLYLASNETGQHPEDTVRAATVNYQTGPWVFRYDIAQRVNAGVADRDRLGHKFGVAYNYAPDSKVKAIISRVENSNVAAPAAGTPVAGAWQAGDTLTQDAILLGWEHMFKQVQVFVQYGHARDVKGASGKGLSGSSMNAYLVGARYMLSKRTWLYASYNQLNNGPLNWGDYLGQALSSAPGGALTAARAGADPRILALGVVHTF